MMLATPHWQRRRQGVAQSDTDALWPTPVASTAQQHPEASGSAPGNKKPPAAGQRADVLNGKAPG